MIYVDELKSGAWSARGPQAQHCRLFSDDPTPDALFAMALQIGLDPASWIPSRAADGTFTPKGAPVLLDSPRRASESCRSRRTAP